MSLVSSRSCLSVIAGRKSYTAGVTAEEAEELYEGLGCKKLKVIGAFKLANDDPANYTDKLVFLEQRRDLSGEYPVGADADLDTGFPVMTGKAWAAVSEPPTAGPPPSVAPADAATVELKSDLVNWHYQIVKLCQRMGIPDVCLTYKQTRLENIVSGLSGGDLQCKLCKKSFFNLQKLRNHIKAKHLKKMSYYCEQCKKYFSDSGALKMHMSSHDPAVSKFACKSCPKMFLTKGQLDKHLNVHRGKQYQCQYCNNKYAHPQGVKEHEASCKKNPDVKPGDTSAWYKCRLCQKKIKHHRSC